MVRVTHEPVERAAMPHIDIKSSDDGQCVRLNVAQPSQPTGITADIPAKEAGQIATAILGAAFECAMKSRVLAVPNRKDATQKERTYVMAHSVGLADKTDMPDTVAAAILVFAIGTTELSIGLQKNTLAELGSSLLMLSADTKKPQ